MDTEKHHCKLHAMSMINSIGHEKNKILHAITEPSPSTFQYVNDIIPEKTVPLGYVQSELKEIPEALQKYASRNLALTLTALANFEQELQDSIRGVPKSRIGVVVGSSTSGISEGEKAVSQYLIDKTTPDDFNYYQQEMGTVSNVIAQLVGATGPSYTISTACSSSSKAMRSAKTLLELELCDVVISGGVDSICGLTVNGFDSLGLLSEKQNIPFSKNRAGLNIGEAACFFVMTKEKGGIQLAGTGEATDGYHFSTPDPEAKGAISAITNAIQDAEIEASEIDYVNLHGTGTTHNDSMEALAVSTVFPSGNTRCSSTKALVGHTLGASGALEAGFCWLVLEDFLKKQKSSLKIPIHKFDGMYDQNIPKIRIQEESCEFDIKDNKSSVLTNSFGFGGSNCALVLQATR